MSELENFINGLDDDELQYLNENVFTDDGVIDLASLDKLIEQESTIYSQKDAVQYSLKINLNSVFDGAVA
jgi:hypothetical protein